LLDSDCKQQQLQQQHPVDDTEQQNIGNETKLWQMSIQELRPIIKSGTGVLKL